MSRHRKMSISRAQISRMTKISRTKGLAVTGTFAFTGAIVAAGVGVHTTDQQNSIRQAAAAAQVTAMKVSQSKADGTLAANNIDAATVALVDSRNNEVANRSLARTDLTSPAIEQADAAKAAMDAGKEAYVSKTNDTTPVV